MPVRFTVSGSQEVGLQLRALAGLVQGGVEKSVTSATRKIQARVVRNASTGRHPPGQGHIPGTGPGPNIATEKYINSIRSQVVTRATATFGAAVSGTVWTDAPQGPRLEYGFHGTDSLGRTYCVDMETEALTKSGWRRGDELSPGDEVLTLSPDTWTMEWQPILAVNRFPGPHQMVTFKARTLSVFATPDHRWLVERYYGRQQRWIREWRTTDAVAGNCRIPLVQKYADAPAVATVDDDIVELAGWFWTEGSYGWSTQDLGGGSRVPTDRAISVTISQSPRVNPEKVAQIERLLTRIFGPPGPYKAGAHWNVRHNEANGTNAYRLDRVAVWLLEKAVSAPDKVLRPDWLLTLTGPQLDLLIETSMAADGYVDAAGVARLGQASERRIRAWEMACILAGRPVVTRGVSGQHAWMTTLLRTSYSAGFGSALRGDRTHTTIERVPHDGEVWCPTTSNGTWLARRDGTIYFTGNSQPAYPHWQPAIDSVEPEFVAELEALIDAAVRAV